VLVAGEVADEDPAKGKGSTKTWAPGAGMRRSLPSRRRQQERRRERERERLVERPAVMTDETQRSEREMRIREINQSEDGEDEDEQQLLLCC